MRNPKYIQISHEILSKVEFGWNLRPSPLPHPILTLSILLKC